MTYNELITPETQINSQDEKIDEIHQMLCNRMQTRNHNLTLH